MQQNCFLLIEWCCQSISYHIWSLLQAWSGLSMANLAVVTTCNQACTFTHACNVATRSAQVSSPVGVRQLIVLHGCCKVAHAFMAASQAEMCDLQIDAIMLVSYPECFVPFTTRLQYHYSAAAVLRSVKWTQIFLYKGHTRGMLFLMHQVPSDQGLPQG
jgi:hypothetical protein